MKLKQQKTPGIKASALILITGLTTIPISSVAGPTGAEIALETTVGTDAANCATTTDITVFPGTMVNYCYRVTNTGTITFETHSLNSDAFGDLLTDAPVTLAPGETFQLLDIKTASSTVMQTATWTANETTNYDILTSADAGGPAYDFVDISTTGTALGLSDDGETAAVLDFPFNLQGNISQDLTIANNGSLRFGITNGDVAFTNTPLADDLAANLIAPFWDDLDSETGDVFFETIGTAPDRVFIVQWEDRPHYNGATDVQTNATVQLKLFEGSNEIQFHYEDVLFDNVDNPDWDNGGSATIGIGGGASAVEFSFNTPTLVDSFAISLTPIGTFASASAMDMTTVTVNEADIEVPQTSIDFFMNPDQMESKDLDIMNVGTLALDWDLEQGTGGGNRTFERLAGMPPVKTPDTDASMGAIPHTPNVSIGGKPAESSAPLLLGGGTLAKGLRLFGDPVNTLSSFDISNPVTVTDVATDAAYGSVFAGDYFGFDFSTLYALRSTDNELISIDTATGAVTSIGFTPAPPGAETWAGMSWDPATNTMYAVSATNPGSTLFTIDLTDASTTLVGTITATGLIIDIAFDLNGVLYGADLLTDELVGIDKTTGTPTLIGPLGIDINFAQDMDFDLSDNTLYLSSCLAAADCGRLFTLNLATGAATDVGQIGGAIGEYTAFGIEGVAFCNDPVTWLSFSQTMGSTNFGQTTTVSVNVDTTGLAFGDYNSDICINSNDPDEPLTVIPVNLEVNDLNNDIIFMDGFEPPMP